MVGKGNDSLSHDGFNYYNYVNYAYDGACGNQYVDSYE